MHWMHHNNWSRSKDLKHGWSAGERGVPCDYFGDGITAVLVKIWEVGAQPAESDDLTNLIIRMCTDKEWLMGASKRYIAYLGSL